MPGDARDVRDVNAPRVAVLSSSWVKAPLSESAVAVRSLAGALSRLSAVDVFVPGDGQAFGDGAFEVTPTGDGGDTRGLHGTYRASGRYMAVLVETGTGDPERLLHLAASLSGTAPVLSVGAAGSTVDGVLDVGVEAAEDRDGAGVGAVVGAGRSEPAVHHVGLYARVHPGAGGRRHYGLGAIPDYLLVLGDRSGVPSTPSPSERARWLLARFAREHVVVVEGGVARAWRSRSCVAQFGVHTRMDLWILMAQARGVVDLLPGKVYARECVEALRYGVPVVVPSGGAAGRLAKAGGGARFSSTADLLARVEALLDPATRANLAAAGREMADRWYGNPRALVARLAEALGLAAPRREGHG